MTYCIQHRNFGPITENGVTLTFPTRDEASLYLDGCGELGELGTTWRIENCENAS